MEVLMPQEHALNHGASRAVPSAGLLVQHASPLLIVTESRLQHPKLRPRILTGLIVELACHGVPVACQLADWP